MEFFVSFYWWILLLFSLFFYFIMRLTQHGQGNSREKIQLAAFLVQLLCIILVFIFFNWKAGLVVLIINTIMSFPFEYLIKKFYKKWLNKMIK